MDISIKTDVECLPIGSVVKLKKSEKLFMIIGYFGKSGNKESDYIGCLFPDGILSLKKVVFFDHIEIKQIYFLGYKNEKYETINYFFKNHKV